MISKSTIDLVFETARVEEVIGEFVHLKKAGTNFKGLSPFSDERTPSFVVSPVKQIWKDFSSGKGGNVVSFLMEHEHYSYPEAIRYLAKKYNIEIEETQQSDEQKEQSDERESMYLVSSFAKDYFQDTLLNSEMGKAIGLSYFTERGFTHDTIQKFHLGYSPNEWSALTDTAQKKGYQLKYLEKTGLTIVKNQKVFDRFKGRVIFPILSMSGRVLGFGGRILTQDKNVAKYLNSPESDIYHKSKILYGIYQAKQAISKLDNCYLVEGYTDVISFHQSGIENVVASSGTALTSEQIRLVRRLTNNITILFDGDKAGIKASLRGIDLILEQGLNVKVLTFPDGEDPDSFAKQKSSDELKEYLKQNAQDFIKFKVSLLNDEIQNDPIKKASLIRNIVESISKIPDAIQQEVYVQECSRILDVSENVLFNELAQLSKKNNIEASKHLKKQHKSFEVVKTQNKEQPKINSLYILEKEIIKILLIYGNKEEDFIDYIENEKEDGKIEIVNKKYTNSVAKEIYLQLHDDEIEFTNSLFQKIYYEIINQLNQKDKIDLDEFVNNKDSNIATMVTDILMDEEKYILSNWERKNIFITKKDQSLSKLVSDAILNLRRILIEMKIKELINEVAVEENRSTVLENVVNYTHLKQLLYDKLNRVI